MGSAPAPQHGLPCDRCTPRAGYLRIPGRVQAAPDAPVAARASVDRHRRGVASRTLADTHAAAIQAERWAACAASATAAAAFGIDNERGDSCRAGHRSGIDRWFAGGGLRGGALIRGHETDRGLLPAAGDSPQ